MKKAVILMAALAVVVFGGIFPAYVDKQGKRQRGDMTIPDSSKIKEFGLYQDGGKPQIYKMRVKISEPCYIIDPADWKAYKKIGPFEVELVQGEPDTFAGFGGTKHGGMIFDNDLPPNPKWLIGVKGCNEAPNYIEITAYRKTKYGWKFAGKGAFYILK